jgi:hypothetical protein
MKNQIKYLQNIFYDLMNDYGQVYVAVKYSENSIIGHRGFTEEEKKKGIILVFNRKNHKSLQWADDGSIITTLGFGVSNRSEKCFLYFDDIVSVFSPDAKIRIDRWDMWDIQDQAEEVKEIISGEKMSGSKKIVSLDTFRKTKT